MLDIINIINIDRTFQEDLNKETNKDDEILNEVLVDTSRNRQMDLNGN